MIFGHDYQEILLQGGIETFTFSTGLRLLQDWNVD
jgi:hypothetical protein